MNSGGVDAPVTVMVIGAETAGVPTPLVAATLKVYVPSWSGLPARMPVGSKVIPGGSWPPSTRLKDGVG